MFTELTIVFPSFDTFTLTMWSIVFLVIMVPRGRTELATQGSKWVQGVNQNDFTNCNTEIIVRPEKFQFLEKWQNRNLGYKIVISVKNSEFIL